MVFLCKAKKKLRISLVRQNPGAYNVGYQKDTEEKIKKNGRKKALFFQCRPSETDPSSGGGSVLQAFVGLADSVMVSSVGEAAVSGVSLIDTVMVLVINIFTALATGGAVITGQFLGRRGRKWPARLQTSCWLLP